MSSRAEGQERGRTAARGGVAVGLVCTLVLAGAGYVAWELRGIAANRADGDPARGVYQQDPERADRTASAVLDGIVREDPEPATDGKDFAGGGAVNWRSAGWEPSDPLQARPAPAEPAIGALFSPGNDGDPDHHCSGVVVHSPGGDLVATAAHCVHGGGFRTNLAFVPGYRDGIAPYGVWVPTRIDVDPRWTADQDPDHDIAFLRLRRPGYPGQRLEDVTGAETIAFGTELPVPARLVGYPNFSEQPLDCRTTARPAGATQLRLDCADVPNGTSGGPVLTDGHTLIGVIGGRDGGGDDETSYSIRFGDGIRALYERSTRP
ncbi:MULTISPECIES: trypsin-like serine peptidase [unclassified Streptomyces]|uniref:trypsin-like serine peptidase n=1 Tax=unclassified Streptomyces TaxID=2593676 RepID=UPI00075264AE|nr:MULTISPECIES: serine protease [unclassified Streptomyces]